MHASFRSRRLLGSFRCAVQQLQASRHGAGSCAAIAAATGALTLLAVRERRDKSVSGPRPWLHCEARHQGPADQNENAKTAVIPPSEKLVLSADCGGTTTRLMLYSVDPDSEIQPQRPAPGTLIKEIKYPNIAFKSLPEIIQTFLKQDCILPEDAHPSVAVLALAGVVMNNQCRFTNLDWVLNGSELEEELKIGRVELINDFVAQGYGMLTLQDDETKKLNDAERQPGAPICCIGAGTGLGQCFLISDSKTGEYHCYPSEGQHGEFGPRGAGSDELQMDMIRYLKIKFSGAGNRISVERVVSGTGISNIYEFLAYKFPKEVDDTVHSKHLESPKDAGIIAGNAKGGNLCEKALELFASSYGAQCATFALYVQPFGGIYLTGGVTKKMADWLLSEGSFMKAYYDKGRLTPLLHKVPLMIVNSDDMGQRGAHLRSVQLLKEEIRAQAKRLFSELDISKDGKLNLNELEALFMAAGPRVGEHGHKMAKQLMDELDANKDGSVSEEEFIRGFKKVPAKLVSESAFLHPDMKKGPGFNKTELVSPPDRGNDPESQAQLAKVLEGYTTRSRRKFIDPFEDRNAPVFQTVLYKYHPNYERSQDEAWMYRSYWINKLGAICYHSVTDGKALLYCTKKDLVDGSIEDVPEDPASLKQFRFRIWPRPKNGSKLAGTEFAAPSAEVKACWMLQLNALQAEAKEEFAKGLL